MQIKRHDKGATYLIVAFRAGSLAAIRNNASMRYVAPMQCDNEKRGTHVAPMQSGFGGFHGE